MDRSQDAGNASAPMRLHDVKIGPDRALVVSAGKGLDVML